MAALALMPLALLPSRRIGQVTYQARKQTQAHLGKTTAYLQEVLGISGILLVKAFVTQRRERARFGELNRELRRLQLCQEMIGRWFYMLMDVLQTAGPAVLWLYGGWLVFHGHVTVGTVVTFIVVLAGRLGGAIGQLGSLHVNVTGSLALFNRIFTLLDLPAEVTDRHGAHPSGERGARSASIGSASPTRPGCGQRCRRSRSRSSRGSWWRWSARPGPASRPRWRWWRAFTIPSRAGCWSTATTSAT